MWMNRQIPWLENVSCKIANTSIVRMFRIAHQLTCQLNRHFGPGLAPLLQVGYRGMVEVDSGFQVHLLTIKNFKETCGATTWESMMKFATSLSEKGTKIAFFSSTPQGGGVALMRHALVRFAKLVGVDLTWYTSFQHSRDNRS